ncbi:hypothetical protein SAMN05421781_0041 [Marinococcus luteus]|uniref:Tetracyclin repressor-like C-terminal domain-containing protein n=1 Tax=Marinococcus luteus TaxID=1122204 RepID=A0A1H2PZ43_9BACI|nr:hypothetical protein [Marinococcus luteus]SDW00091.1 hypothetical protein SAMN05421781_0041 [Marinococcus luteus]
MSNNHDMDELLQQLEEDYVQAVKSNESKNIEDFVEQFLYDSWAYNENNIENIKSVLSRYTRNEIYRATFSGSFNEMVEHLQQKLKQLDQSGKYPVVHTNNGASVLVAFVDGLVIQYYVGIYSVSQLRSMTPFFKRLILEALKVEAETKK